MAKHLALLALLLGAASLFLPTTQGLGGAITVGVFTGTERQLAGLWLMGPTSLAALLGATLGRRRFAGGLGVLHVVLGAAGLVMCGMILGDDLVRSGIVTVGLGTYCATAAGVLAVLAGVIGVVRPEPRR